MSGSLLADWEGGGAREEYTAAEMRGVNKFLSSFVDGEEVPLMDGTRLVRISDTNGICWFQSGETAGVYPAHHDLFVTGEMANADVVADHVVRLSYDQHQTARLLMVRLADLLVDERPDDLCDRLLGLLEADKSVQP